jgi:tRNA nucleotidyltransferase/poly(A) polymerase
VRTKFDFDFVTTATPDQVIELMTDFSPNRPHRWPASSVKAFRGVSPR